MIVVIIVGGGAVGVVAAVAAAVVDQVIIITVIAAVVVVVHSCQCSQLTLCLMYLLGGTSREAAECLRHPIKVRP